VGSEKVLENFSWGSWKSPGFFVSKRVGTLSAAIDAEQCVLKLCTIDWCLSVHPSISLSIVTLVYCIQMAKVAQLLSRPVSPILLVF